ncbi:delta-9 acyl-CoA desaturase [Niveomyces insectorum RCEF 264]|uniref:Delta 8-(E)-sphingolipid desaturase n=1 Tax=Niveomyces insectorum RCEF 264 TaxID=1081102 RepID=A0A167ML17_9HYPO|nr:delta-9 acyl-CoA desaturase [Niveomyces insectorum RCEF 264]
MAASRTAAGRADRPKRTYPLMSRREIESLIAEGRTLIVVDQHVLKVDAWLPYHPGGHKSILHMVGKDATDEVNCLHSPEARQQMDKYRIGRIEGAWTNFVPPIQGGAFRTQDVVDDVSDTLAASAVACSDSEASSRSVSPSPVFDEEEEDNDSNGADYVTSTNEVRKRRPGLRSPSSPSTSPSSVGEADADYDEGRDGADGKQAKHGKPTPKRHEQREPSELDEARTRARDNVATAFLDARTREEISLDLDRYPSLDAATQQRVVRKYRALHETIEAAGLYRCDYTAYAWEVARYTLLLAGMLWFLRIQWYALSAVCLGVFWHQLVFTAHDAGHMGITHSFHGDSIIGIVIADFLGGLSICWWKDNHNVHHIVTNSPEHDPDIEHLPFFAVSHRFLQNLRSSYYEHVMAYDAAARFLLSFQAWSYYVILCFGRFNLYRLSWQYIALGQGPRKGAARWYRWLEAAGQVFFWTWFGYGVVYRSIDTNWHRFVFVLVSHVVTMPLHAQITLSHFAMSTADLGPHESFPQRMLRTTMDVDCPPWLDFVHGGLQFQAIHHLYPRMPRHNLRKAQKLVQAFCDDVGIPYALYGFVDGNKKVIGRLADVSKQAAILAQCQQAIVEGRA